MLLAIMLSAPIGIFLSSDGNNQSSGRPGQHSSHCFRSSLTVPDSATFRLDFSVFGVSMSLRNTRSTTSTYVGHVCNGGFGQRTLHSLMEDSEIWIPSFNSSRILGARHATLSRRKC